MRSHFKAFWESWKLGVLVSLLLGIEVVVGVLFCGMVTALPFILIAEVMGYRVDEQSWMLWASAIVGPYYLGQTASKIARQLGALRKPGEIA